VTRQIKTITFTPGDETWNITSLGVDVDLGRQETTVSRDYDTVEAAEADLRMILRQLQGRHPQFVAHTSASGVQTFERDI
jgi:hypothetical protein